MGFYYAPLAKLERQLGIAPLVGGMGKGQEECGDALEIIGITRRSEISSQKS
jgi:hypothetical protein